MTSSKNDTVPGTQVAPVPDRMEDQHLRIRKALDSAHSDADLASLLSNIEDFLEILPPHFDEEEGPGGAFEEICQMRPQHCARVGALTADHKRILDDLVDLKGRSERLLESRRAVGQRLQDLIDLIREHEREETALLMDCYLVDEGGSG